MTTKYAVKPAPFPVEGAGSETFSNRQLFSAILVAPLAVVLLLGIPLAWYPVVAVILALPTFAGYNLYYTTISRPIRPQKGLPNKPVEEYFVVKDAALKAKFSGHSKLPIETWFEAYFDGQIDLKEGTDLLETLEARYDWASFYFTFSQAKFFLTQWIPRLSGTQRSRMRTSFIFPLGFFLAFYSNLHIPPPSVGPMMIYTSGIITDPNSGETLEQLQQNKLDLVTEKIQLKKGDRHLDIGYPVGMNKAQENGVGDKVNILCMDYRDIPRQKFDKITCLEMAEHVGVRKFQDFLHQVKDLLEDDGLFFLQIAGLRRAWQYEDLMWGVTVYGQVCLPGADASAPLNWVLEQVERAGYECLNVDTIGVHYSSTIYRWYLNWMKNKDKIIDKYGSRWFRVWEVFLAWSTIIARQGSATCYQIVLHKNLNSFDRSKFLSRRLKA
ncbi:S-adenosyl-L-methionine-dependent methyltransferase [Chytridium lagenaria]|nr:S-adenosyl-L-methionine-dependent methyltransferase [Chytridium lagenaria]